MEKNNIVIAPQIENVKSIFDRWKQSHFGNRNDFYMFMTVPSAERDKFMAECGAEIEISGSFATTTIKEAYNV